MEAVCHLYRERNKGRKVSSDSRRAMEMEQSRTEDVHIDTREQRDLLINRELGEERFRVESFVCEKSRRHGGGKGRKKEGQTVDLLLLAAEVSPS